MAENNPPPKKTLIDYILDSESSDEELNQHLCNPKKRDIRTPLRDQLTPLKQHYHTLQFSVHNPVSCNCAVSMSYIYIILPHNLNSTELHLQGVAPRSQYSDHVPEVATLQ